MPEPDLAERAAVAIMALRRLMRKPSDRYAAANLNAARKPLDDALRRDTERSDIVRPLGTIESCRFDALFRLLNALNMNDVAEAEDAAIDLGAPITRTAPTGAVAAPPVGDPPSGGVGSTGTEDPDAGQRKTRVCRLYRRIVKAGGEIEHAKRGKRKELAERFKEEIAVIAPDVDPIKFVNRAFGWCYKHSQRTPRR